MHCSIILNFSDSLPYFTLHGVSFEPGSHTHAHVYEVLKILNWPVIWKSSSIISLLFLYDMPLRGQLDCLTIEDGGNTLLRNVGNHSPKVLRHILPDLNPQKHKCKKLKSQVCKNYFCTLGFSGVCRSIWLRSLGNGLEITSKDATVELFEPDLLVWVRVRRIEEFGGGNALPARFKENTRRSLFWGRLVMRY
jgi:hypothetical protein